MSGTLHSEVSGNVCTLRIDNQEKRNAISPSIISDIITEIESIEGNDDIRVLVLTGTGTKAFSSGYDISAFDDDDADESSFGRMIEKIRGFDYPTIAKINGDVFGGAMELIATCDIRIGVNDARFGIPPAKLGIIYSDRGISAVMKEIGPAYTKEMLFTGDPIDADFATRIGLLNHAVDRDALEDRTDEMAKQIATNAPLSLKGMKRIIRGLEDKQKLTEFEKGWVDEMSKEASESRDHQEGVEAFQENRTPEFEGH